MGLRLGLDVGPTSIGWALVDEDSRRIVGTGVRVFPEGVDRDQQGGEQSKNQTRREKRGMRRQIARRARRKQQLRSLLTQRGLLPSDGDVLDDLLALDPYELRRRAVSKALKPYEIGRVLLHLNQRRGFRSNRKTDKARDKETKGMLAEINELAADIEDSGAPTLGAYLAEQAEVHDPTTANVRIRGRHTHRDMYEHELEAIWSCQRVHHPELLTDEVLEEIKRIIFFQRKMYWPRSVVGECELEPRKKRCPKADRAAQRFRLLQEVNNLRMLDRETGEERGLTDEERERLVVYLASGKQRTFDQMRKKLGLGDSTTFNYERAERKKLLGNVTDAVLSSAKCLGKRWNEFTEGERDAIVRIILDETEEDAAMQRLVDDCGLTEEEADLALDAHLPSGYVAYSREAIAKLLPHLERGLLLMAEDATNSALHAAGYLRPDEREIRRSEFLPPIPDLPNPIVQQAMVEVRKVVNGVVREFGRPDAIHIELAREAKRSLADRERMTRDNAARRRARDAAAEEIEQFGDKPTRKKIDRYVLWEEQGRECVYSGAPISLAQLLSDAVDMDHILPRWRSLDDSLANRVVCFRSENSAKGQQTPREWLEHENRAKYEAVLQRAERLPYGKRRKFSQSEVVLDDFVNRQMTDTAYISRAVSQYLRRLGVEVVTPRGQMTAELRHRWGLNTILDADGRGVKNRADHRHHAVDALVVALTDRKRLHALANGRGELEAPWQGFREGAVSSVEAIKVSQRVQRRLAGALHEETLYGPTQKGGDNGARAWAKDWVEDAHTYVRRKPVTEIKNAKHLGKVRDPAIRAILAKHLEDQGVDPAGSKAFPGDAFKGENEPRMPSGVPIRRVRMLEESQTFRPVSERREGHNVKPGNNHHIVYRSTTGSKGERWKGEVVTMWDAAQRGSRGLPLVERGDGFVMSLALGEMFEIDGDEGKRVLCVVRKLDQRSGRVHYRLDRDARQAGEINKDNLYLSPEKMRQLHGKKVTVDPLGRVRRAGD